MAIQWTTMCLRQAPGNKKQRRVQWHDSGGMGFVLIAIRGAMVLERQSDPDERGSARRYAWE